MNGIPSVAGSTEIAAQSMLTSARCLTCDGFTIVSGAIRVTAKAHQHAEEFAGHRVEIRCEQIQVVQTTDRSWRDLPTGYRWAREDELDRDDAVVVRRTADRQGNPYTHDEADLAVPIRHDTEA